MKVTGYISVVLFLFNIGGFLSSSSADNAPCALRDAPYGNVCVCNVTYCDFLEPERPKGKHGFVLTSSSKEGLRFSRKLGKWSQKHIKINDWMTPVENHVHSKAHEGHGYQEPKIHIDRRKKYQKIIGFGGAFPTAVSYNLDRLKPELQDFVYKSYFAKEGLCYSMIRYTIGGCDFDLYPWAYNEEPENDTELSNFTKLNDIDTRKIQQIKQLKLVSKTEEIKIMACAWSAPKWMKTSHAWHGFSMLIHKYYETWAKYHLRFIELMEASGLPIWAISTGNEPLDGITLTTMIKFVSLGWTPPKQAQYVAKHLGPTIRKSKFKHVKIFGNDDQAFTYPVWFDVMNMTNPESIKYLDGFASHWYFENFFGRTQFDIAHQKYPDKVIISSEGCLMGQPLLGSWEQGEKYADSYMNDLHHWYSGFIDWNMVLDEEGGPNYVSNFVDSPIIANVTSGDEVYKQPIFYAIGHFSKFIPEHSVRIDTEEINTNVQSVAFHRPDGIISCVLLNKGNTAEVFHLVDSERGKLKMTIPPKSIHTIEYK